MRKWLGLKRKTGKKEKKKKGSSKDSERAREREVHRKDTDPCSPGQTGPDWRPAATQRWPSTLVPGWRSWTWPSPGGQEGGVSEEGGRQDWGCGGGAAELTCTVTDGTGTPSMSGMRASYGCRKNNVLLQRTGWYQLYTCTCPVSVCLPTGCQGPSTQWLWLSGPPVAHLEAGCLQHQHHNHWSVSAGHVKGMFQVSRPSSRAKFINTKFPLVELALPCHGTVHFITVALILADWRLMPADIDFKYSLSSCWMLSLPQTKGFCFSNTWFFLLKIL